MAYQTGIIRLLGSAGDLSYYRCRGNYYVRLKSTLTAKDFWTRKCFEASRHSCQRFATGNKLASKVYRSLPKEKRSYALFCELKTAAIHYLKLGLTIEETYPRLLQHAQQKQFILPNKLQKTKIKKVFPYAISITSQYIIVPASRFYNMSVKMGVEVVEKYASEVFHSLVPPVYRRCTSSQYYLAPAQEHLHRVMALVNKQLQWQILTTIQSIAPYPPPVNLDHLLAA